MPKRKRVFSSLVLNFTFGTDEQSCRYRMLSADRQLFSWLVEPVLSSLLDFESPNHTIIFVPEAELYQVPFPSLFGVLSPARLLQQTPTLLNLASPHDTTLNSNSSSLSECFPAITALQPSAHKVVFDMTSSGSCSSKDDKNFDDDDDDDGGSSVGSFPCDSDCSITDETVFDNDNVTADQAIKHFYQHSRFGDVSLVPLHRTRVTSDQPTTALSVRIADSSFAAPPTTDATSTAAGGLRRVSSLTANGGELDALFDSPFREELRRAQPIGQCVRISMLPTLHSVQDLVLKPPPKHGKPTLLWIEVVGSTASRPSFSRSPTLSSFVPSGHIAAAPATISAALAALAIAVPGAVNGPAESDSGYFFHWCVMVDILALGVSLLCFWFDLVCRQDCVRFCRTNSILLCCWGRLRQSRQLFRRFDRPTSFFS